MNCDKIPSLCLAKKMLQKLYSSRKRKKKFGVLGPCTFEPPFEFFRNSIKEMSRSVKHARFCYSQHSRCVAIGDVHGDFLLVLGILLMMCLVDNNGNWTGEKDTLVVFCGDLIDRTGRGKLSKNTTKSDREEIDILQYLYALNKQSGGSVRAVLGNHELMRVEGGRILSTQKMAATDTKQFTRYIGTQYRGYNLGSPKELLLNQQPGTLFAEFLANFCPLILRNKKFLFVHGGLPMVALKEAEKIRTSETGENDKKILSQINTMVYQYLYDRKTPKKTILCIIKKIAWDRTLSKDSFMTNCTKLAKSILRKLGIPLQTGGIVVGHSVQEVSRHLGELKSHCGNCVFRIDLGMSEAFGRRKMIGAILIDQSDPAKTNVFSVSEKPSLFSGKKIVKLR